MIINTVVIAVFTIIGHSQTTTVDPTNLEVTYGCVDSSSSVVKGNYTKYIDWESHSIWIQKTLSGDVYVVYFDDNMGLNMYKAFGLYRCDNEAIYTSQVEQLTVKSPDGILGCEGTPKLFCPALDEADSMIFIDGMNAADGTLDWLDDSMQHFYNCTHWFVYTEETNYASLAALTFDENTWCEPTETNVNNPNVVPGPGGVQHGASDSDKKNKMSATASAILWTIVGAFILLCLCAIIYYVYKWKQKKMELDKSQNASSVGLTLEIEEDKFATKQEEVSTPLVSEEDKNELNQVDVGIDFTAITSQ